MDPPGFEPGASGLQSRRSPSLSSGPKNDNKQMLTQSNLYNKVIY